MQVHGKIADIQVLRGISILLVLIQHFSLFGSIFGGGVPTNPRLTPQLISMPFFIGVELFFIISGYVVTISLSKDGFNGLKFMLKRVFRLMPALVIFVLGSYAIFHWLDEQNIPDNLKALFLPRESIFWKQSFGVLFGYFNFVDQPAIFSNGAMWSLSVEDQFYAAIALVSLVAMGLSYVTRIPPKWWIAFVSAAIIVVLARMRYQLLMGKDPYIHKPEFCHYLLRLKFDFLPVGVLLALFDLSFPGWVKRKFGTSGPAYTGYLLLIPLIVVALCESPFAADQRYLSGFGMPVTMVFFGALVLLAGNQCAFPPQQGWLYKLLVYFGNRSYTIYLYHFPLFIVTWALLYLYVPKAMTTPWRYGGAQIVVCSLMLFPFVELVYRCVEMPLTRYGKRLVEGRKPPKDTPAPAPTILPMPTAA